MSRRSGSPCARAVLRHPRQHHDGGGVTTSYSAADWYPGGALAPAPLELRTVTIKGPASSLPGACSGAMTLPNLVEVDTNQTTLNVFGL